VLAVLAVKTDHLVHVLDLGEADDEPLGFDQRGTTLTPTSMTAQSVLDAVRRVEEAPLADLVGVSVDDVEAQMDHLLGPEIDTASLYRRWER
jgi:hypothetical protein